MKIVTASILAWVYCIVFTFPAFAVEKSKNVGRDMKETAIEAPTIPGPTPADLIPQSIVINPPMPWAGDSAGPITVSIVNQGGSPIGPSKAQLSCFGPVCVPLNCAQCQGLTTATYSPGLACSAKWYVPFSLSKTVGH
jgi:hypothetical protein